MKKNTNQMLLVCVALGLLGQDVANAQFANKTQPISFQISALEPAKEDALDKSEGEVDQPAETDGSSVVDCSCQSKGCGNCCGLGRYFDDSRCSQDPWKLFGRNCEDPKLNVGGWFQFGYTAESNDQFNSQPNQLYLHQGWLYVEKEAKAGNCGELGWGFRFDGMYGIDADDTQAFGNALDGSGNPEGWDNGFNTGGGYGWALPQVYLELAKNDWTVKIGHFYTIIGYEVVTAPDNFFFSHSLTMYNSEPFTHTGVLGSYSANEKTTYYAGWTAGWDTGFDQFGDGSNFLGGFSTALSDDVSFTYLTTIGDFGARGTDGYMHSIVVDTSVTDKLKYILQSDVLRVDGTGEDTFGINQYLLYNVNRCLALGTRLEWWKADTLTGYAPHGGVLPASGSLSYYEATFGANYKLNSNIVIRPEYRVDWSPAANYDTGYFGFDMIATF